MSLPKPCRKGRQEEIHAERDRKLEAGAERGTVYAQLRAAQNRGGHDSNALNSSAAWSIATNAATRARNKWQVCRRSVSRQHHEKRGHSFVH
jgi:hypothetical protein